MTNLLARGKEEIGLGDLAVEQWFFCLGKEQRKLVHRGRGMGGWCTGALLKVKEQADTCCASYS